MPTFVLSDAQHLVATVVADLTTRRQHVANIILGPKREAWFNAEVFVIACNASPYPSGDVAFYGEQNFKTILALFGKLAPTQPGAARMPDLVGHWSTDDPSLAVVVEQKVIYSDDATLGVAAVRDLELQMKNAVEQLGVPAVGIVYMIKAPGTWGGRFLGNLPDPFYSAVEMLIDQHLPSPQHQWVRRPSALVGNQAAPPLRQVQTSTEQWSAFFYLDVAAKYLPVPP